MAVGGVVASCEEHFGRPLLGCRECRRLRVELAVRTGKTRKPKRAEPRSFEHGSRNAARKGLCKVRDGGPCDLCAAALERHRELEREARARQVAKRRGGPGLPRHGTVTRRYRHKCPCALCVEAGARYYREYARRKDPMVGSAERRSRFKHGGPGGVRRGLCDTGEDGGPCDLCLAAFVDWNERNNDRRRKRRAAQREATSVPAAAVVVGVDRGVGVQGAPAHGVT